MHNRTRKRIAFLQNYIHRHLKKWKAFQPGNIVGVRIDRKVREGVTLPYFVIVFHVVKKLSPDQVEQKYQVPDHFKIRFPDKKIYTIRTDVQETGEFSFQFAPVNAIDNRTVSERGTIGLLVTDDLLGYAVTNYHVAARGLMGSGKFFYQAGTGIPADRLAVGSSEVRLQLGRLSEELDVAFVRLGAASGLRNVLPDGNTIGTGFVAGPVNESWRGKQVFVYSRTHRMGTTVTIRDNSIPFDTRFRSLWIVDTIALERCSAPGDSGSVVLTTSFDVLGIVTGADNRFTYVIPYHKIFRFKKLPII